MAKDQITVNLECPKCKVAPHVDDESDDGSMVYCPECGNKFGTFGDVKAKALDAAKSKAQDMLRAAFKGRKGLKLTRR